MIPRLKPLLGWEDLAAAFRLSGEDDVSQFEEAFARTMGQRHAVAFPYGRTGLTLLLEAMGLKGQEVICPAYTCVVVPHAIVTSGNQPVFVDSCEYDFNMDLDLIPEVIGKNTGAIIATSIFGYPVDLDRIDALRAHYPGVRIIQDCAHSFGASWRGRPVQQVGDAAIFGLNSSKLMTSIFGGMVTTDDSGLASRLRSLRAEKIAMPHWLKSFRRLLYLLALYPAFYEPLYGLVNRLERLGLLDHFVRYYDELRIEMPHDYLEGMASVEARVGEVQLNKYDSIVARRRHNAAFYAEQLASFEGLKLPPIVEGATYSQYVLRVRARDAVIQRGAKMGVQFGRLIEYCVPRMPIYQEAHFVDSGLADQFALEALNLPMHCQDDRTLQYVVDVYRKAQML